MVVDPAVSVGSVQVDVARPFRVLAVLMVVRSSVMCTAFTRVVPATSGLSVKPVQLPVQPVKIDPAAGAAVSVTTVPVVNEVEQVAPQEMPVGALVTVPLPLPDLVTSSAKDACMKEAVTEVAAVIVTVQVPVPE